jgi:hypothetical protein
MDASQTVIYYLSGAGNSLRSAGALRAHWRRVTGTAR